MNDVALGALGAAGVLAGLAGTVIPVMPGLVVVWLATAGSLLVQGRGPLVWAVVAVLTGLMIAGTVASTVLPAKRAHASGAPTQSLVLAGVGAVVGFFVIPVLGIIVGGVLGLLLAERERQGDWSPAWDSSKEVLKGYGWGVLLEIAIGLTMGLIWLIAFVLHAI